MHSYGFQYCLKRPHHLLILAIFCCLLIILYQRRFETPSVIEDEIDPHLDHSFRRARKVPEKRWEHTSANRISSIKNNPEINDLLSRIEDLKRIKLSITNELRLIEREKIKLLKEKAGLISKNDKLISQIAKIKTQLKQLDLDVSANKRRKFEQYCDIGRVAPIIFNPLKSQDIEQIFKYLNEQFIPRDHNISEGVRSEGSNYAFDLSLCSLSKEFKFHLADTDFSGQAITLAGDQRVKIDIPLVKDILKNHRQYTQDISEACIVISLYHPNTTLSLDHKRNNLVINLFEIDIVMNFKEIRDNAAVASSIYSSSSINGLDIILPTIWQSPSNYESILGSLAPQSPIERKYLASYFGKNKPDFKLGEMDQSTIKHRLNPLEKILQVIHRNSIDDLFLFVYNCGPNSNYQCYEEKEKMIELSSFLIILPDVQNAGDDTYDLIYLALSRGAIPVIIIKDRMKLPFDEVIDWSRATILLHAARLPEIHFILKSIGPPDLYQLKYHGRRIFENYLATAKQILETTIAIISLKRFNYPPAPVQDVKTVLYNTANDLVLDTNCSSNVCLNAKTESLRSLLSNDILGPREKPFPSESFRRNFSLALSFSYDLWNNPSYSPFHLFPSCPTDPLAPSEFKFFSPDQNYRPIAHGLGGSGPEFSRSLGGDFPNEQFTIVLLTYERKSMLMLTLERLKGLPYLNKVLIVWNGVQHRPTADLVWPDIGVPLELVKVDRNSLNNRFLPYDTIQTDAILSMDDDSPLRPDEIIFAFRVWRQSRDRIVGFPGRYHAWDSTQNSWMYNSNHSCELSMVLTGGAFFHKYYSYIYTYNMPEAIRSIVDKFMNCEDIAMNFLVAHLTRKPPIKVTSRWTFHCAGCSSSLSEDDSHFRERHECLNTFASIYGYMPLLSTQHRSDSVLFKTRLPHDKQKCFRFV